MDILNLFILLGICQEFIDLNSYMEPLLLFILITFCSVRYNRAVNEDDPVILATLIIFLIFLLALILLFGLMAFELSYISIKHFSFSILRSIIILLSSIIVSDIISDINGIKSRNVGRVIFTVLLLLVHIYFDLIYDRDLRRIIIYTGSVLISHLITNSKIRNLLMSH